MALILACDDEIDYGGARNVVFGDELQLGAVGLDDGDHRLLHVAVSGEPVDRPAGGSLNINTGQQELGKGESRVFDTCDRHGARDGWVHELPFALGPFPRRPADLGGREFPADLGGRKLGAQCRVLCDDVLVRCCEFARRAGYRRDLTHGF